MQGCVADTEVLIAEDVFGGEDDYFAAFAEFVDGQIFDVAEYSDVVYAAFHIFLLECFELVEIGGGKDCEEFAAGIMVVAEVAVGEVFESEIVVDGAFGAAAGVETGLGKFEGSFAAWHLVDDFIECVHCIEELVVLGGDRSHVCVVAVFLRRFGESGPC